MFHLSLPVERLETCVNFYRDGFGAETVPVAPGVVNLLVFDCQLTLHERPDTALTSAARREMHFGATVSLPEWRAIRDRLRRQGHQLMTCIEAHDSPRGRAKLMLADPGGNLVEINAARSESADRS